MSTTPTTDALAEALRELVAVDPEHEEASCECVRCGTPMKTREGCEPTPECDSCAQDLLHNVRAALAKHDAAKASSSHLDAPHNSSEHTDAAKAAPYVGLCSDCPPQALGNVKTRCECCPYAAKADPASSGAQSEDSARPTILVVGVRPPPRALELLTSANKWVRMIEERRDEVPGWLRHGADPAPLRKIIEEYLRSAGAVQSEDSEMQMHAARFLYAYAQLSGRTFEDAALNAPTISADSVPALIRAARAAQGKGGAT